MSESTNFLVENYKKTFEVYNAISSMETEVLSKFDEAIRFNFKDWVSGEWICTEGYNLYEDYEINILRKEWVYKNEKSGTLSYIWPYFRLKGDDPIWTFFGLPNEDEKNYVHIHIWLSEEFKQLPQYQKLITEFDNKNQKLLEDAGFSKKGGNVNRWYELPIYISNTSILKGLQEEDWEEATSQLKNAWGLFSKIDWEFLRPHIKKHQKTISANNSK